MNLPIREVNPDNIIRTIQSLEHYFRAGGVSIIQAAFSHSFFVAPESARTRETWFPERARMSRQFYPGGSKGQSATWERDGRSVVLDDNQYAQNAWTGYTGCPMQRGSGYSLRHIWGHPWDPDAYTAGWNLCYMPFWAGMLTEDQHLHERLRDAIRQASWDLHFRDRIDVELPDFVLDPGLDLPEMLGDLHVLVMNSSNRSQSSQRDPRVRTLVSSGSDLFDSVKAIRMATHQSWKNIMKATLSLQGKPHAPFGTLNVERSSLSVTRRIMRETGMSPDELEELLTEYLDIEVD